MKVVFNHSVGIFIIAIVAVLGLDVGAEVHASAIPPTEERLSFFVHAGNEILGGGDGFIIDGFHTLLGEWAGVLNGLPTFAVGLAMQHAARTEYFSKGLATGQDFVAGIVLVFRLFFGVKVVEVTKELVEAVHGRQVFVAVALMVLAEMTGCVAETLHYRGHSDVCLLPPFRRAWDADLSHAGADRARAVDEGGAAGGTALLTVIVGEALRLGFRHFYLSARHAPMLGCQDRRQFVFSVMDDQYLVPDRQPAISLQTAEPELAA